MVTKRGDMSSSGVAGRRGRQQVNSQATQAAILEAAGRLFGDSGYEAVTMRRIAEAAGCSHTAIYRYFPDKESLLEELTRPVLEQIARDFEALNTDIASATERLVKMSMIFVRFGLRNRNMFRIFVAVKAERVDREPTPGSRTERINRLRIELFQRLQMQLTVALGLPHEDDRALMYSRGLYYLLHGMIATYEGSGETDDELLERLEPTFEHTIRSLLNGYRTELEMEEGKV
ncbi:MAG: TetR/AcrR family transcriptional regulator [Spirochaetaceae bacterium]|nr:MAG: TetR/AcrR family transcriptional regulator [Spirochaetaceae bacterium]